jgi:hypothetical protein
LTERGPLFLLLGDIPSKPRETAPSWRGNRIPLALSKGPFELIAPIAQPGFIRMFLLVSARPLGELAQGSPHFIACACVFLSIES